MKEFQEGQIIQIGSGHASAYGYSMAKRRLARYVRHHPDFHRVITVHEVKNGNRWHIHENDALPVPNRVLAAVSLERV